MIKQENRSERPSKNCPFGLPPDIELDCPAPLSVNKTRRVNFAAMRDIALWRLEADKLFLLVKRQLAGRKILGRYEAIVTLNEKNRLDIDNGIKGLLDLARHYELVEDDSPKYLRKLTVKFGDAPHGAKLVLRPCE